jgi:hypothetical protein
LKDELSEKYNAPVGLTDEQKNMIKCSKYSKILLEKSNIIGEKRIKSITNFIQQFIKKDINNNVILEISKMNTKFKKHGEIVVDNIKDNIEDFIKLWRQHFIDSMKPKYMPKGWNVNKLNKK